MVDTIFVVCNWDVATMGDGVVKSRWVPFSVVRNRDETRTICFLPGAPPDQTPTP